MTSSITASRSRSPPCWEGCTALRRGRGVPPKGKGKGIEGDKGIEWDKGIEGRRKDEHWFTGLRRLIKHSMVMRNFDPDEEGSEKTTTTTIKPPPIETTSKDDAPPLRNYIMGTSHPCLHEYWSRPDIHSLGNMGFGGALHAAMAPLCTKVSLFLRMQHCIFASFLLISSLALVFSLLTNEDDW